MMGRGASIDPQTLAERQKIADLMYQRSLVPAENEQSMSQGIARMLQGGISGYDSAQIQNERNEYKEQKRQDMQKLGEALGTGNYKDIIGQLNDPDTQMAAIGLAKSDMENTNKFNREKELKGYELENNKELENHKFGNQMTMEESKQEGDHNLEWLKSGNRMVEKRDEKMADPVKEVQARIGQYTRVINDPNAPPEIKAEAVRRIEAEKNAVSAMKPPSSSVTVNTGKAETAGQTKRREEEAKYAVTDERDIAQGAIKAGDQLFKLKEIKDNIVNGKLSTSKMTPLGTAIQKTLSILGKPNDSAAIANYLQTANDQLVTERLRLKGQGQISDRETRMLEKTVLMEGDTLETIADKISVFEQLAERQQKVAQLTQEWKKRAGGIDMPLNGKSYTETLAKMVDQNPLMSYENIRDARVAAAAEAAQASQGGAVPQ